MKVLLLIAHGSRLAESNNEVQALSEQLKQRLATDYELIVAAFLELCSPSISQVIDEVVEKGAVQIDVMPYFLNKGRHVTKDVPNEIQKKITQYPQVAINLLPYFGRSELIPELLQNIIQANNKSSSH